MLKSYDNIHSMTKITKIMLSDIVIIKTGYFDVYKCLLLKIKLVGIANIDNIGYHFVSLTKTRDKIATMYNILIII